MNKNANSADVRRLTRATQKTWKSLLATTFQYFFFFSLRKAKVHADALEQLCAESTIVDARSKLETQAYAYWITGNVF